MERFPGLFTSFINIFQNKKKPFDSMEGQGRFGPLVGAIDEGTSSARFLVFAARTGQVVTSHQLAIEYQYPQEGWVEQDPKAILGAVLQCIDQCVQNLKKLELNPSDIVALGVTNQRETTVAWDRSTGQPLHNAIVWLDMRTVSTLEELLDKTPQRSKIYLKSLCGLPLSPYFSALKIRWLIDHCPAVRQAIDANRCCFGTIDTWLIWNLTGGPNGGVYITDVTNASRTMLMNLESLAWDPTLCRYFNISPNLLPEIRSSSEIYGYLAGGLLQGVPISGCLGDQQAALVGQRCFNQGQAKSTYGTGCFLLYNTGPKRVASRHGLVTTVAYRLGPNAPPIYALEGSVAVAGAALSWLRDNIQLLHDVSHTEVLAEEVRSTGDVYFVPAFSGLYAPYWQQDARGVICGITEETSQAHIIRAALEAVCFQTRDILEAMDKDSGCPLKKLQVDGGMTNNNLLLQLQADITGISVMRPVLLETTALGAAMAAGSAQGINIWELEKIGDEKSCDVFNPTISGYERDVKYSKWKMAVKRSFAWETT